MNPGLLSVAQTFNRNRRVQLTLLSSQLYTFGNNTVIKEFAFQKVQGYHLGYQKS